MKFKRILKCLDDQSLAFTSGRNRGRDSSWQCGFLYLYKVKELLIECRVILFVPNCRIVLTKHANYFPYFLNYLLVEIFNVLDFFIRVTISIAGLKMRTFYPM